MVSSDLSAALGQLAPNPQWASAPRGVWTCSLLQAALLTVQPLPYFGGTGNASISKEPAGCSVKTARSVEEHLGHMIPHWDASVGTVQLNIYRCTFAYLPCPSDIYRDGRAPLKTLVVSFGHL